MSEMLPAVLNAIEADIRKTLKTLHGPGDLIELRIFNGAKVGSNYYSDHDRLINDILRYEREKHPNYQYYITLNELNPDVAARRNSVKWGRDAQPTTADVDVQRRRYIYIDFDPVRASGISAADAEKENARDVMERARDTLKEQGFPEPVIADSGNGYWLLYRVDIRTDPATYDKENVALHRRFLQFIESNVEHDGVSIDLKVVNAARIVKLFGTISRKGMNTVDRPHRRSRLIEIPERQEILGIETLKEVVKIAGTDRGTSTKRDSSRLDVAAKLQEWGVTIRRVKEDVNGTRYILEICPFDPSHDRGEAWVFQFNNGAIAFACHHHSCKSAGHDWSELRAMYEPGYVRPSATTDGVKTWWASKDKRQNQEELAELFVKERHDRWAYSFEMNECVFYNGNYWETDTSGGRMILIDFIKGLIELIANDHAPEFMADENETADLKLKKWKASHNSWLAWIVKQNNARNQDGILTIAKQKARVSLSEFDRSDYLLNCKNGTIDLKTGDLLDHDPKHRITLMIPVNYKPAARFDRWDQFLTEAVGRYQYVRYLQKEMGYCLTGSTAEEIIIILYGEESTGKSTFYEPIMRVFGAGDNENAHPGYGHYMRFETLKQTSKDGGAAREDMLRLRTCRAVICSEIEKNTVFNTALVKKIASGEPLVARGNYAKYSTEYSPRFKIVIGTNYMPIIPFDDSYRRFRVHPFVHAFEGNSKDKSLKEDFLTNPAAKEHILAWLVEGCLLWQQEGLNDVPREVTRANAAYRKSQNPLNDFLDDYCILDSETKKEDIHCHLDNMVKAFNDNRLYYGGDIIKEAAFGKFMKGMGYKSQRTTQKGTREQYNYFEGIRLKNDQEIRNGYEFYDLEHIEQVLALEMLERCAIKYSNLMRDAGKYTPSGSSLQNKIENKGIVGKLGIDPYKAHHASTSGRSQEEVVRVIQNETAAWDDSAKPRSFVIDTICARVRRRFPDLSGYPLEELIAKLIESDSKIERFLVEKRSPTRGQYELFCATIRNVILYKTNQTITIICPISGNDNQQ